MPFGCWSTICWLQLEERSPRREERNLRLEKRNPTKTQINSTECQPILYHPKPLQNKGLEHPPVARTPQVFLEGVTLQIQKPLQNKCKTTKTRSHPVLPASKNMPKTITKQSKLTKTHRHFVYQPYRNHYKTNAIQSNCTAIYPKPLQNKGLARSCIARDPKVIGKNLRAAAAKVLNQKPRR